MKLVTEEQRRQLEGLRVFLGQPGRLQGVCLLALVTIAYLGVYDPLSSQHRRLKYSLREMEERVSLVLGVDRTRRELVRMEALFPVESAQLSWWADRFVAGCRDSRVFLVKFIPKRLDEQIGDYQKLLFSLEIKARYGDLVGFIGWIESSPVPMRIVGIHVRRNKDGSRRAEIQVLTLRYRAGGEKKA